MAIQIEDIVEYWRKSELNSIADYSNDGNYDDDVIQSAIDDAYAELFPITEYIDEKSLNLYAKRLTICTLISRINPSADSVELPMNDCFSIRETIEKFMMKKLATTLNKEEVASKSTTTVVTPGDSSFSSDLKGY